MKHSLIISLITFTLACCKKKSFPKGGNNISCNDEVVMYTSGLGGAEMQAKKCKYGNIRLVFFSALQEKIFNIDKPSVEGNISYTNTQTGQLYYSYQYGGTGNITILKLTDSYIYGTFEGVINASDGSKTTINKGKFDIAL